ncbi:MAG: hypothetical protein HY897_01255 [Deltaproteobacteria bacterium]|nr:hypothetical protein [Deltaproteobacteria bacterium]
MTDDTRLATDDRQRLCRKCGCEMKPGDLRYEVHIEVKAGVDTLVIGPDDPACQKQYVRDPMPPGPAFQ